LLFVVGLEINIPKLKTVGPAVIFGGLLQIAAIYIVGFYVGLSLGFSQFEAIIIGLVLTFSSTMIVVKLLSDSEQIDTLHGRIALGILLIQDLVVFIALPILATLNNISVIAISSTIIKILFMAVLAFLLGKFVFPKLFNFAAKSPELLFMSSITVLFLFTIIAHLLEFSLAIGAFLAGLSLSNLPYHHDVIGKVNPLKSFFATLFFVSLGMQLTPIPLHYMKVILIFLAIVVLAKPTILYILTSLFGYEKRTSFLTGLTLAQTSEFSLIIVTLPFIFNLISQELFSIVIFLAIITMIFTSYFIEFRNGIYWLFTPLLKIGESIIPDSLKKNLEYKPKQQRIDTVLVGAHRMGAIFLDKLTKTKKNVLVIDNNPEIIKNLLKKKVSCIYGEIRNKEIMDQIKLKKIKTIISTVPHEQDNLFLLDYARMKNPKINFFLTANHFHEAKQMYKYGADYVILPHLLTGEKVSMILQKAFKNKDYLKRLTKKHVKLLGLDESIVNKF